MPCWSCSGLDFRKTRQGRPLSKDIFSSLRFQLLHYCDVLSPTQDNRFIQTRQSIVTTGEALTRIDVYGYSIWAGCLSKEAYPLAIIIRQHPPCHDKLAAHDRDINTCIIICPITPSAVLRYHALQRPPARTCKACFVLHSTFLSSTAKINKRPTFSEKRDCWYPDYLRLLLSTVHHVEHEWVKEGQLSQGGQAPTSDTNRHSFENAQLELKHPMDPSGKNKITFKRGCCVCWGDIRPTSRIQ